jgi:hypothetical protein
MADEGIVALMRANQEGRAEKDPLAVGITDAGTSLRFATLALRSCYTVNAPSIREFNEFREDLTTKANVYKDKVLPLAQLSLQKVKDFMLYFKDLSFEDCLEIADDIVKESRDNQALMVLNRDTHKEMSVEFKQMEDRIETVLAKCSLEAKEQQKKSEAMQAEADSKSKWAIGLAFVPLVGLIAAPLLEASASDKRVLAVAAEEEAKLAVAASVVIKETLARALTEYCFAMDRCAGEFEKLASDCESFAGQAEKLSDRKKQTFYKLMNKRADNILDAVSTFQMVRVSAETDLECLPSCPEPNYVRQWLASKKAASGPSFMDRMLSIMPEVRKRAPALTEA